MMKNLKELALKTITEHVDRFNLAFQHSSDSVLQMSMVFLQREFSFYLISELIKQDSFLEEKYFLLLLNKYSQVLDLMLSEHCDLNYLAERFSVMGESLVNIRIQFRYSFRSSVLPDHLGSKDQDSKLQQFVNSIISKIKKVKILKIPQLCNDDTLKLIALHCKDLTELDIRKSEDISFAGFKSLFKKTKSTLEIRVPIKKLNMKSTIVDDKVIYYLLKHLTCLEVFIYSDIGELLYLLYKKDVLNSCLSDARKCNLTFLDFTQYYENPLLTDILEVCSQVCPFLTTLTVPTLNELQVELISKFPALKSLHLKGEPALTSETDVSNYLTPIKNKLLELKISYFSISIISIIQNCPNLQLLYLNHAYFVHADYNKCDLSLSNLCDLTLHSIYITNDFMHAYAVMKLVNSSPNLKNLTINFCQDIFNSSEEYLVSFLSNSRIERLELNYNSLEIRVLERIIQNCSSLKIIVFKTSFMNRDTIQQLSLLPCVLRNDIKFIY